MNETSFSPSDSNRLALLEAVGLHRSAAEEVLLADISLNVCAGDRIAVVGPTGSGKTLLLRALAMLDPLDAGDIRWRGKPICGNEIPSFRSQVMYLHQRPALLESTVDENLRHPFTLQAHRHKQFEPARIAALLESLGRGNAFLAKNQRDLSGGEAQLTALLRAMQLDPQVLLLDEPTAALDAEATSMVETLVQNWLSDHAAQRAAVWVTHDQEQAVRISNSMLTIRNGRLM